MFWSKLLINFFACVGHVTANQHFINEGTIITVSKQSKAPGSFYHLFTAMECNQIFKLKLGKTCDNLR